MPRFSLPRPATLLILIVGLLLGWLTSGVIRYIALPAPASVHYHANFQMVVDGQPVDFAQAKYMEETTACYLSTGKLKPRQRAHLHNNDGSTVHVHTDSVSWGQFFQSLNFNLGPTYFVDDTGTVYANSADKKVHYFLNGSEVQNAANTIISDDDRLLVAYGSYTSDQLKQLANAVPTTAHDFDERQDPATCSGAKPETRTERLKRAFLF